jgi:hypothetical protein
LRTWAVAARRRRWTVCYVENRLIPIPNCHWQNGFAVMFKMQNVVSHTHTQTPCLLLYSRYIRLLLVHGWVFIFLVVTFETIRH